MDKFKEFVLKNNAQIVAVLAVAIIAIGFKVFKK